MSKKVIVAWSAGIVMLLCVVAGAVVFSYADWFGINVILRRGGTVWPTVQPDDPRLSGGMRAALQPAIPAVKEGTLVWKELAPGISAGELPVLADGKEVDRILLTRVDPSRFRLEVHTSPAGDMELDDWMKSLGAVMVINGSYYGIKGQPATPLLSDGSLKGPRAYAATHGALVVKDRSTTIVDLRSGTWDKAFSGAHDALVSYPLLVSPQGAHVGEDSKWLANRSFVAQDAQGMIVFGTTSDAFFSLHRLADFLGKSSLGLTMALNLDGGPLACQAVSLNDYKRNFCGERELQTDEKQLKLLQPLLAHRRWALPIVISVVARKS